MLSMRSKNESDEKDPANGRQLLETDLLEQTLYKLGALMAIGYGEAGSRIIGQNMK